MIYSKYAGTDVELDKEEYIIVKQSDILCNRNRVKNSQKTDDSQDKNKEMFNDGKGNQIRI